MGVDYYSIAAIGCLVPREKGSRTVYTRNCSCEIPEEFLPRFRYCPKCGIELLRTESEWIFSIDELPGFGLIAVWSTDSRELVVASIVSRTGLEGADRTVYRAPFRALSIDAYRRSVQEFLEPYGLWDPDLFGLWSVLYVSY